ncbi:MAG: N-acetyltransferase [Deltaproteobacteria bacterium]|nr:N-acetyltransferase [Deltaproteobacteria bacterium]MBW2512917.1 N-acetyltransferase [Deltaproteobacteria bacterium]
MIRKAILQDARQIHRLLLNYAKDGLVLSRSLMEIFEAIRDFYVFVEGDRVVGAAALNICWEDLAEVRSLVVDESFAGRGIGKHLVEACLSEARTLGIGRVFALTYQQAFFEKLGFSVIEKSELPQKIWGDCIKCAKFPECDEIALSRSL